MSLRFLLLSALLLLHAAAIASPARVRAQDDGAEPSPGSEDEARLLFERGRAAYERELYTEAEDAFMAAYEAMPPDDPRSALILLNVAQAIDRQGGRNEDALEMWRRFEAEARGVADDSALLRASERIRELEARVRRRHQDEPVAEPVEETPPPEPEGGFSPHWSSYVLIGVGGAAVIAGAIVGIAALSKRSSVLDMCEGTVCAPEARDDADRVDGLALGADLLLWPGLALAATGAVLMFTLSANEDDDTTISARCGLGGCVLGGTF